MEPESAINNPTRETTICLLPHKKYIPKTRSINPGTDLNGTRHR